MYNAKDQLTELVRRLEEKNHIFTADPLLITEKLQKAPSPTLTKLHHRASRIDSDGKLAERLITIDSRIRATIWGVTVLWFVLGFIGLFGVMQADVVNFFYVLASILGFHTLMLVMWLGWMLFAPRNKPNLLGTLFNPNTLIRGNDIVSQTAVELYQDQLKHTGTKWYISRLSHQFWLASLLGMFSSLVLLLLVKNYSFVWESTLLQNATVVEIVKIMAWLPNLVGFPTPTAQDIITAQMNPETVPQLISLRWAMLLIGSLLMYGIVPRLVVWLVCLVMVRSSSMKLDLKLPYYQKIVDFWQRHVVDPDDSPVEQKPTAPTALVSQHKKLIALLEYPYNRPNWYQPALGQSGQVVDDIGILDDRDDMAKLVSYLAQAPVQVLLGIPPQALPDRGTMRKLDTIAQTAKGGLIVQLLEDDSGYLPDAAKLEQLKTRRAQWEAALAERQIGIVRG